MWPDLGQFAPSEGQPWRPMSNRHLPLDKTTRGSTASQNRSPPRANRRLPASASVAQQVEFLVGLNVLGVISPGKLQVSHEQFVDRQVRLPNGGSDHHGRSGVPLSDKSGVPLVAFGAAIRAQVVVASVDANHGLAGGLVSGIAGNFVLGGHGAGPFSRSSVIYGGTESFWAALPTIGR